MLRICQELRDGSSPCAKSEVFIVIYYTLSLKWVITGDALVLQDNNVVSEQSNFIMSETTVQFSPKALSLTNVDPLPL